MNPGLSFLFAMYQYVVAEVCEYLHISPRTLQTLRDTRQIPFTVVSERNILYPESAIRETQTKNYRPTRDPF